MTASGKPFQRTLAVVTDSKESEFVQYAERGISRVTRTHGWKFQYLEAGALSYPGRLALLKQLLTSGEFTAAMYLHLLLTDDQAALFRAAKIPLGFLAGNVQGVDCVLADDSEGAFQAGRHLVDLGHKKLALILPPAAASESFLRGEGFKRALAESRLTLSDDCEITLPDHGGWSGHDAALQLLRLRDRPTGAFVAAGDLAALGFIEGLHEKGLQIPRDFSVIGYDDLPIAETLNPPLSSVRQPLEAMAGRLTEHLIEVAERPKAREVFQKSYDPELVLRLSTAVPPKH